MLAQLGQHGGMAGAPRSSVLSIELSVTTEEDSKVIGNTNPFCQEPAQALDIDIIIGKNPQKSYDSNHIGETDPQFLHSGRWPNDNGQLAKSGPTSLFLYDEGPNGYNKTSQPGGICKDKPSTTPAQFSMVIDHWTPEDKSFVDTVISTSLRYDYPTPYCKDIITTLHDCPCFDHEINKEHLIRQQTVDYMEELEDSDTAAEIVAMLEGYRQIGWAAEMIVAFPCECLVFWLSSGNNLDAYAEHTSTCSNGSSSGVELDGTSMTS